MKRAGSNPPDREHPDPELAAWADAMLRSLPLAPAPPELAARIMATVRQRARRFWWHQAWWDWPRTAQAASLVLALALASLFGRGSVLVDEGWTLCTAKLSESSTVNSLAETAHTLWDASTLLLSAGQPWLVHALLLLCGLYALCAGLGTVLFRLALRRA